MKAELKPRINLDGRTALETVIPLSTPFVLFIDPASVCNFKCKFCPTGDRPLIDETGRWQGRLHMEVFTKVIDDLQEFEKPLKVLRMYKEGEPLLNKNMPQMIKYAKASGRVPYIDTTTNGYLLTPKNVDALMEAGLDRINISVDGLSDEMFWDLTQTKVDFKKFVEQVKYLHANKGNCEICIKMLGDKLNEDERKKFYDVFGDLCDRIFLENLAPCWPEFDAAERMDIEITKGIYQQDVGEVDTCPYIFYSISVNSDGTVSLCFLDWARKLVIGDTTKQSLKSIWDGEELFQHRLAHLQGNRKKNPVCGSCGQLSHCLPDNIDPYRAMLAQRLIASRQSVPA
jgi:radical SAM protein with 4Fe4S-binding SPASM domain